MQRSNNETIYDDPRKVVAAALLEVGDVNPDVVYI